MAAKRRASSPVRGQAEGAASVGCKPGANGVPHPGTGEPSANGGGRGQVAEIQRARILTAMVQEVSERGGANVSVAHVVARSGVSRRTFYELFDDREDCFLAAFDDALDQLTVVVVPAYEQAGSWQARIRAGLTALLEHFDQDTATGGLLVVESLVVGQKARERRGNVLANINRIVDQGRTHGKTSNDPPALTAEGIVGGVLSVIHARLIEKSPASLLELANPLMGMIVLPYLGPAAARKETNKPTPKPQHKQTGTLRNDPLQDLPMRFTYRTMRVLMSIAELGGRGTYPSNRAVGERAGIGDQGQASKLLARLHKLGLIENQGGDPARGEPNAWALTTIGKEIHNSIAELEG